MRKAVAILGWHPNTLRKYADEKRIQTIRNPAGQRMFNVDAYLRTVAECQVVCYARVSSAKQKDDLDRQVSRLQSAYPCAEIIKDIGSGLNFKRKGLQTLLERLLRGDKLKIVVTHRDRLARFGVDVIRFLIEKSGGELLVLDPYVETSKEAELTADLLAILHHFSCRMHGQRSHKSKENSDLSELTTEDIIQTLVRNLSESLQRDGSTPEPAEGTENKPLDVSSESNTISIA